MSRCKETRGCHDVKKYVDVTM